MSFFNGNNSAGFGGQKRDDVERVRGAWLTRRAGGSAASSGRVWPLPTTAGTPRPAGPQLSPGAPSVPVSTSGGGAGGYAPPPGGGGGSPTAATSPPLGFGSAPSNTLDEPILETVKRDLKRIYKNLVMVVFPFKDRSQQSAALRNWDLWGPMVRASGGGGTGRRGLHQRPGCTRCWSFGSGEES